MLAVGLHKATLQTKKRCAACSGASMIVVIDGGIGHFSGQHNLRAERVSEAQAGSWRGAVLRREWHVKVHGSFSTI
jgi:hypothetical protein